MINQYEVLGVHASATDLEIREAYRRLARQHHPDRGGDPARFAAVTAAYAATGTATARAKLAALYALHCPPCPACDATGAVRTMRGFTAATVSTCQACGGAGYTLTATTSVKRRKR